MTAIQKKHARDTEAATDHNDATHFDPALVRRCPACKIPVEMMVHGQRVATVTGGCLRCATRVLVFHRTPWRQPTEPIFKAALKDLPDVLPPAPRKPKRVITRECGDCHAPVVKSHQYCAPCLEKRRAESLKRSNEARNRKRAKRPLDPSVVAMIEGERA